MPAQRSSTSQHWYSFRRSRGKHDGSKSLDVSKMQPYIYSSLQASSKEIRLLTLLPGGLGTDLHCNLHKTVLDKSSPPQYEALSYTWGSAEDPDYVYVEKGILHVTHNLASALQHLRCSDRPRILWVDAICVNQQDLEERSQQVPRMADIYALAENVVVWLGPEGDDSSRALKTFNNIGSMVEPNWIDMTMRPSVEAVAAGEFHWADRNAKMPFKSRDLVPAHHLLERTWFERLWIRQEIVLATNAVLVCGFNTITWSRFRNAICYLHAKLINGQQFINTRPGFIAKLWDRILLSYNLCLPSSDPTPFSMQIYRTKDSKCSDPRDRIYALLSISKIEKRVTIIVDYTKSTDEVYRDVVLQHYKYSLSLLTHCEMQNPPSERPSWIPAWDIRRPTALLLDYLAGGNAIGQWNIVAEANTIALIGIKVAKVKTTKSISFPVLLETEVIDAIKEFAPPGLDLDVDQDLDVYCRTIVCDQFSERSDPPRALCLSFQESLVVLKSLLQTDELPLRTSRGSKFIGMTSTYMHNRTFFWTEDGRMGLGPPLARPTDDVVVFPGCPTPMILRPSDSGIDRYRVVGECFILDLMNGEAVLGPLPQGYQCIKKINTDGTSKYTFRDNRTGISQDEDPRLGLLESDLREDGIKRVYRTGVPRNAEDRNHAEFQAWTGRNLGEGEEIRIMIHSNELSDFLLE